jgi:hypothetical protein
MNRHLYSRINVLIVERIIFNVYLPHHHRRSLLLLLSLLTGDDKEKFHNPTTTLPMTKEKFPIHINGKE